MSDHPTQAQLEHDALNEPDEPTPRRRQTPARHPHDPIVTDDPITPPMYTPIPDAEQPTHDPIVSPYPEAATPDWLTRRDNDPLRGR